jgi:methionyl-tRNA synthetase
VYALHEGAAAAFRIVDAANEYIAETAPWALAKDAAQTARLDEVLFTVAEAIRVAAVLLLPVMPSSCAEILRRVGESRDVSTLRLDVDGRWRAVGVRELVKAPALWPRAEQTVETIVEEKAVGAPDEPVAVSTPDASSAPDARISIDDFAKVELRAAKVLEAEAVPKSKKLIKLTVDVGREQRVVLAGIAEAYQPEELVGRTVVIVANLKPAKLMGIESNGMVLAASTEAGRPTLLTLPEGVEPGWRVR